MISRTVGHTSGNGVVATRGNNILLLWLLFTSIDCASVDQSTGIQNIEDLKGQEPSSIIQQPIWYKSNNSLKKHDKILNANDNNYENEEESQDLHKTTISNSTRDKRSESLRPIIQPNRVTRNDGTLNKNFLRFGRAKLERNFLRFGRGSGLPGNFLRYGRLSGLSKNFLRFGRNPLPNTDTSLEFGNENNCIDAGCSSEINNIPRQSAGVDYQNGKLINDSSNLKSKELIRFRRYEGRSKNNANAGKRGSSKLGRNFVRFGKRSKLEINNFNSDVDNEYQ